MKKKHYLICTLLAATIGLTAGAQTMSAQKLNPGLKLKAMPAAKSAASVARADDDKNVTVLINEDFSGFTAGTEDQPDATKLVNDMGDFTNPAALQPYSSTLSYKKWGGEGLYSAGGCIAIKDGWFLNTPAGDMSGDITLTFRARIANGANVDGKNGLKVIFLSRKALIDYGVKEYTLTGEWQTFTYTSDKGAFEATGFQFWSNLDNNTVLIDDVRVEKTKKSIAAPEAQAAEDATENSFKAVWTPSAEAQRYLLSVYSKTENHTKESVAENFAGINANESGIINATAPNYPEGWKIVWKDATKSHIAKINVGGAEKTALRQTDEGDCLTTPIVKEGMTSLKFWIKPEKTQQEVPYGSYVQLSFDTDYGLYPFASIDLAELSDEDAKNGLLYDLTEIISMFDGVYSLTLEYVPVEGDNTTMLMYDFSYDYPTPPTLDYLLQDKEIKAASKPVGDDSEEDMKYTVTGLNPDLDYFYTVKAANSEYVSEPSKEIEVYTVSQPQVLEPTDVTANSYTARWTSNKKVDYYRVEQIQKNTIDKDTENYEILYEDFSKVTSDFKESDIADGFIEQGEYTSGYKPIDDLTHIAGWKASSTQRVEGWLGGMAASGESGTIAGAIMTPTLDLSHNDGECNVTVRAWGQEDDWLVIQGVNAAAYAGIRFPEGGFVETTVTIPACTAKESLTFYSNNYYPFLIDYIRIQQNVKAGEMVSVTTASVHTADATVNSMVMDNPNFGTGHDVYYKVTGLRYYHGDKKDVVASAPSELMLVKNPSAGIMATEETSARIAAVDGGLSVYSDKVTDVMVFSLSGQHVAAKRMPAGNGFIALAPGVYMVKTTDGVTKVVVR